MTKAPSSNVSLLASDISLPASDVSLPAATQRDLDLKVALAQELVRSLERAIRSHRLYEPGHVLHGQATEDLVGRCSDFFDRFSYLRLIIKPDKLLLADKTLLQTEPRDPEVPFRLYRDGVRELRLHRGISREEILDFLSILETDPQELFDLGEDFVSAMWTKDFRSIDYQVVDEFELGADEPGLDPEQARTIQETAKSIDRFTGTLRALEIPAGEQVCSAFGEDVKTTPESAGLNTTPISVPEEAIATAFALEVKDAAEQIRQEIENETLGGTIRRSIDSVLELFSAKGSSEVEALGPLFRGVASFYISKKDFAALGHLLVNVQEIGLIEGTSGDDRLREEIVAGIRQAANEAAFLNYFTKGFNGDYEGLSRFFEHIGPVCVGTVAAIYGRVGNGRTRGLLRQYLTTLASSMTVEIWHRLLKNSEGCLAESFQIMATARPAVVADALHNYLANPDPKLRLQALSAAVYVEGPSRVRALRHALGDQESKVRTAVLKLMAELKDPAFLPVLEQTVSSRSFTGREVREKLWCLRAIAACGGTDSFKTLTEIAGRKPLFIHRARQAETRHAAILAIAHLGTTEAMAFLNAGLSSDDKDLAEYCREALGKKS